MPAPFWPSGSVSGFSSNGSPDSGLTCSLTLRGCVFYAWWHEPAADSQPCRLPKPPHFPVADCTQHATCLPYSVPERASTHRASSRSDATRACENAGRRGGTAKGRRSVLPAFAVPATTAPGSRSWTGIRYRSRCSRPRRLPLSASEPSFGQCGWHGSSSTICKRHLKRGEPIMNRVPRISE